MSYGDIAWVENPEFVFVKDGHVTTVTGLTHGEKRHVDARDAVGQGCFRRKDRGRCPFEVPVMVPLFAEVTLMPSVVGCS